MAAQGVMTGSAVRAREWSGLRPADQLKATPVARGDSHIAFSRKGHVVQMTLSVEKKQFTTQKSEETFNAAKVSPRIPQSVFLYTSPREFSCQWHHVVDYLRCSAF